jgi:hypothetical protein
VGLSGAQKFGILLFFLLELFPENVCPEKITIQNLDFTSPGTITEINIIPPS